MHENGEQDCRYCYLFEGKLPDGRTSFCQLNLMNILTLFCLPLARLPSQSALLPKNVAVVSYLISHLVYLLSNNVDGD